MTTYLKENINENILKKDTKIFVLTFGASRFNISVQEFKDSLNKDDPLWSLFVGRSVSGDENTILNI